MAKVSRSMLKSIVKECLVELLSEGLSSGNTQDLSESFKTPSIKLQNTQDKSRLNSANTLRSDKVVNPKFENNTKQVISNATNDPVMAALLEDTAKTTLQEQNDADSPNRFSAKPTDSYSQAVSNSDPMELFGGASNNWASLAFSDTKSK